MEHVVYSDSLLDFFYSCPLQENNPERERALNRYETAENSLSGIFQGERFPDFL
jgi:hypothetical protein